MAFAVLDLALTSAVALLVTIDPVGTGPIFAALTRGSDDAHRRRMAVKGVVIAAVILFVFAFVGEFLLRLWASAFRPFGSRAESCFCCSPSPWPSHVPAACAARPSRNGKRLPTRTIFRS